MIDTLRLTAEEAARLLREREISRPELRAAYRDAIAKRDPELHCYLHVCEDGDESDGLPIALKDMIGTRGIPTTAGSRILEGYVPVYDATVVERCKAYGSPSSARPRERRPASSRPGDVRGRACRVGAEPERDCALARERARGIDSERNAASRARSPRT